jgi:hypothetical protein
MGKNEDKSGGVKVYGVFDNPIADWENDDLVLTERHAAFLKSQFPSAFPALCWPELQKSFGALNEDALKLKQKSQKTGRVILAAGIASLLVAALCPVLLHWITYQSSSSIISKAGAVLSATLAAISVLMGLFHAYIGKTKMRWLQTRFVCERLRHFYFQAILSNLPTVISALESEATMNGWLATRNKLLERFQHEYADSPLTHFENFLSDQADAQVWIFEEWKASFESALYSESASGKTFANLLLRQRLGIQISYSETRLKTGINSPGTQYTFFKNASISLTLIILILTLTKGIATLIGVSSDSLSQIIVGAALAIGSAGLVALVTSNDGFQLGAEAERLDWYLAALRSVKSQGTQNTIADMANLLWRTEELAYAETRKFMTAQKSSKFIM